MMRGEAVNIDSYQKMRCFSGGDYCGAPIGLDRPQEKRLARPFALYLSRCQFIFANNRVSSQSKLSLTLNWPLLEAPSSLTSHFGLKFPDYLHIKDSLSDLVLSK
uniref:Uncharacterized protein n=1 Tax=Ascaris lumbricoides TaxID=6252 RepID=A0A0M3I4Q8_ASCLU